MQTIFLPTRAFFKNDVQTMLGLLERLVPASKYKIGLEIMGTVSDFQTNENVWKIIKNIKEVAGGIEIVVHGFSGIEVFESKLADMRTGAAWDLLKIYCYIAVNTKASYVHVHSGAGYKGYLSEEKKLLGLNAITRTLANYKQTYNHTIGIENLPAPCMGDVETDPNKIWLDCVDSLDDNIFIAKKGDLKITFDTCHHACGLTGKIDLVSAIVQIKKYLHFLHISDVSGYWVPHQSVWKEGVIPGNGRIGKESFKKFLIYVRKNYPDIGIELEVYNDDFSDPKESEESIKRVLKWLD